VAEPGDLSFTIFKITRKGSWVVFKETLKDNFVLNSHVVYIKNINTDSQTSYIIADHESFFLNNKDRIIELAS
jgi:hypothetical protein